MLFHPANVPLKVFSILFKVHWACCVSIVFRKFEWRLWHELCVTAFISIICLSFTRAIQIFGVYRYAVKIWHLSFSSYGLIIIIIDILPSPIRSSAAYWKLFSNIFILLKSFLVFFTLYADNLQSFVPFLFHTAFWDSVISLAWNWIVILMGPVISMVTVLEFYSDIPYSRYYETLLIITLLNRSRTWKQFLRLKNQKIGKISNTGLTKKT